MRGVLEKCGNAGIKPKCGISRTIAGRLTPMQSIPIGKHHIRHCMGMWLSNGLHHLWCGAGQCYFVSEEYACKVCGCAGVDTFHLLRCEWASCEQMNMDNYPTDR